MNYGDEERRLLPQFQRWMTSDGSPWWLRNTVYSYVDEASATVTQPSGDYEANCYMNVALNSGAPGSGLAEGSTVAVMADSVTFDDSNCAYHSKAYYCQSISTSLEPKEGSPDGCKCKKVEVTGTYLPNNVLIKCENCLDVYSSNQENSCPYGTKIFSPETREDWKTFLASSTAVRNPHWIIDITRPQDGCGGCEEFAMNSNKAEVATWRTKDLSPWFLRDTVHIPASYDYKANCYFNVFAFDTEDSVIFDAGTATDDNPVESTTSCWIHSASYFCQSMKTTTTTTTTLAPAKCDSLPYTAAMCPSGTLKANQSTIDCESDVCEDGDPDDENCCEDKAKCDTYLASYCPSGQLLDNAAEISCSATTCADGDADDTLCCVALETTPGWYMTDWTNQKSCTAVCSLRDLECSDDSSVIDSAEKIISVAASVGITCTGTYGPYTEEKSPTFDVDQDLDAAARVAITTSSVCNYKDTSAGMHCDAEMPDNKRKFCNCLQVPATCDSLYTAEMCASGALKADQSTLSCTSDPCVDGDADDELCCEAAMCSTYTCADNEHLISASETTEQGATPATTCCEATYVVGTDGGNECPSGATAVSEDDCNNAVLSIMASGETQGRTIQSGSWSHVPPGCSRAHSDNAAHYNTNSDGNNDGTYEPVCMNEVAEYYWVDDGCLTNAAEPDGDLGTDCTDEGDCTIVGQFRNALTFTAAPRCCYEDGGEMTCSNPATCPNAMSFADASKVCTDEGKRLCTKDELVDQGLCCSKGGGCDNYEIWTSTAQ